MDDKKTTAVVNKKPTIWTKEHEKILIDWGDKAMCYRWLHAKSHNIYTKTNTYFTIPVIIMSTLTGTANFAQDRVPEMYRGYYSMTIGFVNILAGIITTIQQFLKITELNEAHRVSSISWDKFYRKIRVELAKPPHERQGVYDFLKSCTEEFDRLMETSPTIDKEVINLFAATFNHKNLDENKKQMFEQLKKPEICDTLESIELVVYKPDESEVRKTDYKQLVNDVVLNINQVTEEDALTMKYEIIEQFIENFKKEMTRRPTKQEIMHNVGSDELNITETIIDSYLSSKSNIVESIP
tara:strand:- start:2103 stop:2993 length:891 start_codon:yes stop_codon:yes gene_type:complete